MLLRIGRAELERDFRGSLPGCSPRHSRGRSTHGRCEG